MAKISVIVPVYKVEEFLNRCVESILNQTFSDFELILVDDGSPDNCPKMCDDFALLDKRVKVIHKTNGGLSDARNVGLDYAFSTDSEYVTFVDSDDYLDVKYLSSLYGAILENKVDISVSSYIKTDGIDDILDKTEEVPFSNMTPEKCWLKHRIVSTIACAKLFKKELFNDIRFPIEKMCEDEYTTYKLLFSCKKIAFTTYGLYFYYTNPESITQRKWSVSHLDGIDAQFEQLEFFSARKLSRAFRLSVHLLARNIAENIICAKESQTNNEYQDIIDKYTKILRKFISENKHYLSITKDTNAYCVAYPNKAKIFLTIKERKQKIRKFIKKIAVKLHLKKGR